MTPELSWRPGAFRRSLTLGIRNGRLEVTRTRGGVPVFALPINEVAHMRATVVDSRGNRIRRLELTARDGTTHALWVAAPRTHAEHARFAAVEAALVEALPPDLPVFPQVGPAQRRALFRLGIGFAGFGLMMLAASPFAELPEDRIFYALFALFMVGSGGAIAWPTRPGLPDPSIPLSRWKAGGMP